MVVKVLEANSFGFGCCSGSGTVGSVGGCQSSSGYPEPDRGDGPGSKRTAIEGERSVQGKLEGTDAESGWSPDGSSRELKGWWTGVSSEEVPASASQGCWAMGAKPSWDAAWPCTGRAARNRCGRGRAVQAFYSREYAGMPE